MPPNGGANQQRLQNAFLLTSMVNYLNSGEANNQGVRNPTVFEVKPCTILVFVHTHTTPRGPTVITLFIAYPNNKRLSVLARPQ